MVKAHESWFYPRHSAWQLPDLNCMSGSVDPRQPECLPSSINPGNYMFSANVPVPGFAGPGLAKLKTEQTNEAHKLLQILPPRIHTLVPNTYPYPNEKQPAVPCGLDGEATPNVTLGSLKKGLFVFDQSGNQTRLIYSSVCPSVLNPPAILRKQVSDHGFLEKPIKTDEFTSVNPIFCEESDENHISGKEFEMHEDTEEINALLYSDEDDDYSDDDEEVASIDGPKKRQKLLDGGYNISSQTDIACSVQLEGAHECENDAESSHANGETQRKEVRLVLGNKRSRKDKIHKTLRILQGIIPGANGKDPLSVLDEAIDYLQCLKLQAGALGV
ncbi:putative Transcription factor [Melia azedarach]|uniref:Transcription factor n=1 Tax=Melia azedarach TaxID=155640 RepID=A0ACC1Y0X7_MELAZ|nr:putative Transcription factor [Melia azedarach]